MKRVVLLFALLVTGRLFAMEPDVPAVDAHSDSCIVDIEALVGKQSAMGNIVNAKQIGFMTVKDGQLLIDTAKIPAAVAEFERTTRWEQLSPRTRTLIKVTLLGLTAIATGCTGYLTGYDFITILFGYITGEAAASVLRGANFLPKFLGGLTVMFLDSTIEVLILNIHYYYGFSGVSVTVFLVRTLFNLFASLTDRWTRSGATYAIMPRATRKETDREFNLLHQEIAQAARCPRSIRHKPNLDPALFV